MYPHGVLIYGGKMKKFYALVILVLMLVFSCAFAGFSAASAEAESTAESEPPKPTFGTAYFKGIISAVTDTNEDGLLDAGGKAEIKLLLASPAGYVNLSFSESEFDGMALTEGENANVCTEVGAYCVNAVVSMEYYGDFTVFEKAYFTKEDIEKIENGFISAALGKGEATVLPEGNEVYSTYLSTAEGKKAELYESALDAGFAFEYNAESGKATLCYRGVKYTLAKKLGASAENPILVTENGKPIPFAEVEVKLKSLAEGEMLALFGDLTPEEGGEVPKFELLDIKSTRPFAPVSEIFGAHSALKGEARSYVLFDREVRAYVPHGRAFCSRVAEGAGLALVLSACEPGAGYYENVKLYKSASLEAFTLIRGEKITAAQNEGEYIRVMLESGKTALLPGAAMLENTEMTAELFYELGGSIGSVNVRVNAEGSSWFSSLINALGKGGEAAESLIGLRLTAALGEGEHAVFAEIE